MISSHTRESSSNHRIFLDHEPNPTSLTMAITAKSFKALRSVCFARRGCDDLDCGVFCAFLIGWQQLCKNNKGIVLSVWWCWRLRGNEDRQSLVYAFQAFLSPWEHHDCVGNREGGSCFIRALNNQDTTWLNFLKQHSQSSFEPNSITSHENCCGHILTLLSSTSSK